MQYTVDLITYKFNHETADKEAPYTDETESEKQIRDIKREKTSDLHAGRDCDGGSIRDI